VAAAREINKIPAARLSNKESMVRAAGIRNDRQMTTVNAGARLDRLPVSAFHRRVFVLVAIGMFFDGFDIYTPSA
jgi:hypothetical protein